MPGYVPNRLLSDLLDVYEKHPATYKYADPSLLNSLNKLRLACNKAPLAAQGTITPPTEYLVATLSVNPPTSSNPGFKLESTGSTFSNNHWEFPVNVPLTFSYSGHAFPDIFAPVALRVTGEHMGVTDEVSCSVNGMEVFTNVRISQSESETPGVFEFYIPAPCFVEGENKISLTLTAATNPLRVTALSIVSVEGIVDLQETVKVLSSELATIGAYNTRIVNGWQDIIAVLKKYPELKELLPAAEGLQSKMKNQIIPGLRSAVLDLKTFMGSFINVYFPRFMDPTVTKEQKLAILAEVRKSLETKMPQGVQMVDDFFAYKKEVGEFRAQVQAVALKVNEAIKQELDRIDREIKAQEDLIDQLQLELFLADLGMIALNVAASIGKWAAKRFLGPYGPVVSFCITVVSKIFDQLHKAYVARMQIRINECYYQIAILNQEKEKQIRKQQEVADMVSDVNELNDNVDGVTKHTRVISDIWDNLKKQIDKAEQEFQEMPGDSSPAFESMNAHFEDQFKPYFVGVTDVLQTYLEAFST